MADCAIRDAVCGSKMPGAIGASPASGSPSPASAGPESLNIERRLAGGSSSPSPPSGDRDRSRRSSTAGSPVPSAAASAAPGPLGSGIANSTTNGWCVSSTSAGLSVASNSSPIVFTRTRAPTRCRASERRDGRQTARNGVTATAAP
eukprot:scaffold32071_cov45-Phaeocystis_antarctica.AAC.2